MAQIAKEWRKDPSEAAFDLVAQGKSGVSAIYHMMSERDIETALRFPWTSIGSDAGTAPVSGSGDTGGLRHPRTFGNFPRVIARYVKEKRVLTLEEAVRKMTSWPATRMRLVDRGLIREGMYADVNIFDLDKLQDLASYENPNVYPAGIEYVLVNGQVVIEQGRHTGARPGRVLYGPGRSPS